MTRTLPLVLLALLAGCSSSPPKDMDDLCAIFREKDDWYQDAARARDAWNSPIPVMMAIMHQESRFAAKVKPPRRRLLGFIPGPRLSSAYGYSQAKKVTWAEYQRSAGRWGADRDEFGDAIDFIGWYNDQSRRRSGIASTDTYGLYLAYHEGHGGYNRTTYRSKPWLMDVAGRVQRRAAAYQAQLAACEADLQDDGWFFGWF